MAIASSPRGSDSGLQGWYLRAAFEVDPTPNIYSLCRFQLGRDEAWLHDDIQHVLAELRILDSC